MNRYKFPTIRRAPEIWVRFKQSYIMDREQCPPEMRERLSPMRGKVIGLSGYSDTVRVLWQDGRETLVEKKNLDHE